MQRLLIIDGHKVDIDDKTAIGITLQSYDIKNVGAMHVNISNSFTVPITYNNLGIFGNPQSPFSKSTKVYEEATCNYFLGSEQIIKDGRIRLSSIQDRITLFIFEKDNVWDAIKLVKWDEFGRDFLQWMQTEKGLPSSSNPFNGTLTQFLTPYANATEGVFLPFFYGNLYNKELYKDGPFLEDNSTLYIRNWDEEGEKADGGHFCIFYKTIFEYIEHKYDVNFLTSGGQTIGNIWDDEFALRMFEPLKNISLRANTQGTQWSFYWDEEPNFLPLKDVQDKQDKTLSDLVGVFFKMFNILKDEIQIDGKDVIRLARFDELETIAPVVDFSGRFDGIPKYEPLIQGYNRSNVIKFKEVFEQGDSLQNARTLTSENRNLDATATLMEIDAYIPATIRINGGVALDLSPKEAFKTFTPMIDDGLVDNNVNVIMNTDEAIFTAPLKLKKAALYSLEGEYRFLDKIIKYPVSIEWNKWLTLNDIRGLEFFKQYYIDQLGGFT